MNYFQELSSERKIFFLILYEMGMDDKAVLDQGTLMIHFLLWDHGGRFY